ncbi:MULTISPECIES: VOC family protein [unclassified Agromyces]|uniref:VOC family protein n=1 Tax=unclassified Agromyces TaxID=2639701 RepID=UPI0030148EC9
MFENSIAMATLAASDLDRSRRFWRDVFGLEPGRSDMGGDVYLVGGVPVIVYESQFAGTNRATGLSILTDDLDRDMAALREKGVVFHDYDLPELKTENGVVQMEGERGAWFDDSEGNIIALAQPTAVTMDEARSMLAAAKA